MERRLRLEAKDDRSGGEVRIGRCRGDGAPGQFEGRGSDGDRSGCRSDAHAGSAARNGGGRGGRSREAMAVRAGRFLFARPGRILRAVRAILRGHHAVAHLHSAVLGMGRHRMRRSHLHHAEIANCQVDAEDEQREAVQGPHSIPNAQRGNSPARNRRRIEGGSNRVVGCAPVNKIGSTWFRRFGEMAPGLLRYFQCLHNHLGYFRAIDRSIGAESFFAVVTRDNAKIRRRRDLVRVRGIGRDVGIR